MNYEPKVTIVFPAYNEEKQIAQILKRTSQNLSQAGYHSLNIIVVDDGSTDNTASVVSQMQQEIPITLLKHPSNQGLGAALQTGINFAVKNSQDKDIILTSESDGSQRSSKLIKLIQSIQDGADFAAASPLGKNGFKGVPFYRRFLSQGANLLYRLLFPIPGLYDYTNLNRGFRAELLKKGIENYGEKGFIDRKGFEAVPDILLKLRQFHPKVSEIDIQIDISDKEDDSSMDVIKTIWNSLDLCASHLFKKN